MAAAGVTRITPCPRTGGDRAAGGARADARRRASARLTRWTPARFDHARFTDLPRWLSPGDLLVVNTSGTLNAALTASAGGGTHSSCISPRGCPETSGSSRCDVRARWLRCPITDARAGTTFELDGRRPHHAARAIPTRGCGWTRRRDCGWLRCSSPDRCCPISSATARPIRYSYVPKPWPASMYQTVFATEPGSAEMPSAGRPFTPELVTRLVSGGIQIAPLLLHTGVASQEDHEPPVRGVFRVPADTADRVNAADARAAVSSRWARRSYARWRR